MGLARARRRHNRRGTTARHADSGASRGTGLRLVTGVCVVVRCRIWQARQQVGQTPVGVTQTERRQGRTPPAVTGGKVVQTGLCYNSIYTL